MTRRKNTKREETLVQSIQRRFDGVEDNSDASLSICSELYRGYCESCMKSKKTFFGFEKGQKGNSTVAEFLRNVDAFVDGVLRREIVFSLESGEKVLDTIRFLEWCVAGRHVFTAKCVQGMGDEAHKHTLANYTSSLLALYSIQDEARYAVQTFRQERKRKEKARQQKLKKKLAKSEVSNIYSHLGADDDGIDEDEEKASADPVSSSGKPSVPAITAPVDKSDEWERHEKDWENTKLISMELVKVIATQDFGPSEGIRSIGTDMVTLPPFNYVSGDDYLAIPLPVETVLGIMKRLRKSRKLFYSLGSRMTDPQLTFVDVLDISDFPETISVTKAFPSFLENVLIFLNKVSDEQLALLNAHNHKFWSTVLPWNRRSFHRIPTERDYSEIMSRLTSVAQTQPLFHTFLCLEENVGWCSMLMNPVGREETEQGSPMTVIELRRAREKARLQTIQKIRTMRPDLPEDIARVVRMEEEYAIHSITKDDERGRDFERKELMDYVNIFDWRARHILFLPVNVVRYQVEDDSDDDGVILYIGDTRVEAYINTLLQERAGEYGLDIHDASKNATHHESSNTRLEYVKVSGIVHMKGRDGSTRVPDLRGRDSLYEKTKQMEAIDRWMDSRESLFKIDQNWDDLVEMLLEEIFADHVEYEKEGALTKRLRELEISERLTKKQGAVETTEGVKARLFRRLSMMKLVPFKLEEDLDVLSIRAEEAKQEAEEARKKMEEAIKGSRILLAKKNAEIAKRHLETAKRYRDGAERYRELMRERKQTQRRPDEEF